MSIKSRAAVIAISAYMGLLAACSRGGAPETSVTSGQAEPQAVSNSKAPSSATLTVSPGTVDGCNPNQPVIATVSWHSKDPHVRVMVSTAGHAEKLFSEGGFAGSAKTEQWVLADTEFTLVDAQTGAVLAKQTVTKGACK